MKIAVTGSQGFVGSHLTEALVSSGHDVVALDQQSAFNSARHSGSAPIQAAPGDIRDQKYVSSIIAGDIDLVYHLAAVVGVHNYLSSPFDVVDVNILGTRNVLMAAADAGARVVLASTSEVYGKNPNVPWAESDDRVLGGTQVDRWSYSTSKAAAEHFALAAHRQLQLPVSVVRYFNAYGPRQVPEFVISKAIHRVLNGKPPLMYDSGTQTRCFTYIADIVRGTVLAGTKESANGEVFNLGSITETTIAEAIAVVLEESGSNLEPSQLATKEILGPAYQDIQRRVPDASKAQRLLGREATTTLRNGVRSTIEWAQAHPDWLAQSTNESAPTTSSDQP